MSGQTMTPRASVDPDVATAVHALRMLHALGDTPDQVAAALTAAGFTGNTCFGGDCPIAHYLLGSGLQAAYVDVLGNKIALGFNEDDPDEFEVINTPRPVEEFIARFDKGAYSWLNAGDVRQAVA